MPEYETIEDLIEDLPAYFREVRPYFAFEFQRHIDLVELRRAIGLDPRRDAEVQIIATRLKGITAKEPGAAIKKVLKEGFKEEEIRAVLRPRQYDQVNFKALAQQAKSNARSDTNFRQAVA